MSLRAIWKTVKTSLLINSRKMSKKNIFTHILACLLSRVNSDTQRAFCCELSISAAAVFEKTDLECR